MSQAAEGYVSTLHGISKEAFITVAGIATSVVVVLANWSISKATGYDVFSWMFWFIIPVGSVLGGLAAASGYYGAARLTQTMPSRRLGWYMILIGACTWIMSEYLDFATLRLEDGTYARSIVSFVEYWRLSAEHSSVTLVGRFNGYRPENLGEAGWFGYVRQALQLLGFLLGGFAMHSLLSNVETCDDCRLYAQRTSLLKDASLDVFDATLSKAEVGLPDLVDSATPRIKGKTVVAMHLDTYSCPKCPRLWLRPSLVVSSGGNSTDTLKLLRYAGDANMMQRLKFAAREATGEARDAARVVGKQSWMFWRREKKQSP